MPPSDALEKYNDCPRQSQLQQLSGVGRRMAQMDHVLGMGYVINRNDFKPADWETHAVWKSMLDDERARRAKVKQLAAQNKSGKVKT